MSETNRSGKASMSAGLLAALVSSVCCIGPLVAGVAGLSGAGSAFSALEPLRPFLIGFTVLALGYAFFQAYKPKKTGADCCTVDQAPGKKGVFRTRGFLWIVTVLAALFLTFPYYSGIFYAKPSTDPVTESDQVDTHRVTFEVEGMTCTGCEHHIEGDLGKTDGVLASDANYEKGTTEVTYDASKISKEKIIKTINNTGYTVTSEAKNEEKNGD